MNPHLIIKLRNKIFSKNNNLGHMMQNLTSIVESNWIFSKFYLLIYIYIYIIFVSNEFFFSYKKGLINIKSFKLFLPLILYIVLNI